MSHTHIHTHILIRGMHTHTYITEVPRPMCTSLLTMPLRWSKWEEVTYTHTHMFTHTHPQGPKADVYLAAYNTAEAALRMVMVGGKNTRITKAIAGIASDFKCNAVQGVLSQKMQQHKINCEKVRTFTHTHAEYTHTIIQPHAYICTYIHTTLLYTYVHTCTR